MLHPPADAVWAIGMLAGPSPFALHPVRGIRNPVLTARDVDDVRAGLVADPFLIREGDGWRMFFEVYDLDAGLGRIATASSPDALRWKYGGVVLSEPFHLSYPHVFRAEDRWFMIPETHQCGEVRLYETCGYSWQWRHAATLLEGRPFVDATPFFHGGEWWMFASTGKPGHWYCGELHLFHAGHPGGPWRGHPWNPVVSGTRRDSRPAGRVIAHEGGLFRFSQDCRRVYGRSVSAHRIDHIDSVCYYETLARRGILDGVESADWNSGGMHHLDACERVDGGWLACFDGWCPGAVGVPSA